jgi:hypothetical protein
MLLPSLSHTRPASTSPVPFRATHPPPQTDTHTHTQRLGSCFRDGRSSSHASCWSTSSSLGSCCARSCILGERCTPLFHRALLICPHQSHLCSSCSCRRAAFCRRPLGRRLLLQLLPATHWEERLAAGRRAAASADREQRASGSRRHAGCTCSRRHREGHARGRCMHGRAPGLAITRSALPARPCPHRVAAQSPRGAGRPLGVAGGGASSCPRVAACQAGDRTCQVGRLGSLLESLCRCVWRV